MKYNITKNTFKSILAVRETVWAHICEYYSYLTIPWYFFFANMLYFCCYLELIMTAW